MVLMYPVESLRHKRTPAHFATQIGPSIRELNGEDLLKKFLQSNYGDVLRDPWALQKVFMERGSKVVSEKHTREAQRFYLSF